jgi:hypothetical protein
MIPAFPALGIRFDIGKIESANYGFECWKVLWKAVDLQSVRGVMFSEGDTMATLNGNENVFCIGAQVLDSVTLPAIRAALESSLEFRKVSASPAFVEGPGVLREPLVDTGRVDLLGEFIGSGGARAALAAVGGNEKKV